MRQHLMALGPESEGRSFVNRAGHSLLSLVPETAAVIDKAAAGLMDWKNAAAVIAGTIDPAIPAAYFGTQGVADLTGIGGGESSAKKAVQNPTPENVQNALLSGAQVVGAGAIGNSPRAGAALQTAPAIIDAAKTIPNKYYAARTSAVRATEPAAASVPARAAFGVEKIYRAAAPVGSDPQFRGNLYKAAGDLAEIGRDINLQEAKGGIIQPDMRVRATVKAINDHLEEMYNSERKPQIDRNAQNPIVTQFGDDATEGLTYLARRAGSSADRSLAVAALSAENLPLSQVDKLAKVVNKELLGFESMTPAERAAASTTNRRLAGLKALDSSLGEMIGQELENRGEAGIREYEGRYAALSNVRDQLQKRMNAVELERSNPAGRLARSALQGKAGIASASQAAVADVNIGTHLQQGLKNLADSGITANRGMASAIQPVRGLLGTGATQLPGSSVDLYPPNPTMPFAEPTTKAERLGRLLPQQTQIELEKSQLGEQMRITNAPYRIVRDPRTGRMRRIYLTDTNGSGQQR
jgi:hypothetical protein